MSKTVADQTLNLGFRAAAINHAAQNFTMPALSPTMTEGNIATWKVKEGACGRPMGAGAGHGSHSEQETHSPPEMYFSKSRPTRRRWM